MLYDLILKNRSYRRFYQNERPSTDFLTGLVDLARLSPSSRNQQALKFKILSAQVECDRLFPSLAWAGYLKDWDGPAEGERPAAYIIILGDTNLGSSFSTDIGIAAQSILLGAVEKGLGGCIIASIKRDKVRQDFDIPEYFDILLVIALGKPAEKVTVEEMKDGDIQYWRDSSGVHHVPKRGLNEIIVQKFQKME